MRGEGDGAASRFTRPDIGPALLLEVKQLHYEELHPATQVDLFDWVCAGALRTEKHESTLCPSLFLWGRLGGGD